MKNLWQRTTSSFAASCLCFGRPCRFFHRGGVGRPDRPHGPFYMNRWDPNPKGCFFLRGNTEIHQINALNVQYSANMSWNKYSDALRNLGSLRSFEIRVFSLNVTATVDKLQAFWCSSMLTTTDMEVETLQENEKERYWWYLYISDAIQNMCNIYSKLYIYT